MAKRVVFTSTPAGGKWEVPAGVTSVKVLVVAGGGAGGGNGDNGGGGGAGGVKYDANYSVTPGTEVDVTVGSGGAGGTSATATGGKGGDSKFATLEATGGGGGGGYQTNGADGGSGGGAGSLSTTLVGGSGTVNQGNDGGDDSGVAGALGCAGGGGAGAAGSNNSSNNGGNGGAGVDYSTIFGTDVGVSGWFAGGGGGGAFNATGGTGGSGGGKGGDSYTNNPTAGTANTGGGGGGAGDTSGQVAPNGAAGGSGVVIVQYEVKINPNDWEHRRKITIDKTKIDADLTHFPVLLKLGSSVGIGADDVTSIFDELGANSKKIAITKSDGETQIYGEIERWDSVNEVAEIWVSKSDLTIDNDTDTILYFYYDNTKDDNTDYIGDVGSASGELVWDSSFKAVDHLKDTTTSTTTDSTSNDIDGTKKGANEPIEATGKIGKGQDFDGSNDYVSYGDNFDFEKTDSFSIQFLVNTSDATGWHYDKVLYSGQEQGISIFTLSGTFGGLAFRAGRNDVANSRVYCRASSNINNGAWRHIVITYDGSDAYTGVKFYIDGAQSSTVNIETKSGTTTTWLNNANAYLGMAGNNSAHLDGLQDEFRVSSSVRSAAYVKADYNSSFDTLITWGDEEPVILVIQDSAHTHTAENVVVTQKHTLVVQDVINEVESDNIVLTQKHTLVIENVQHIYTSENLILIQKHTLAINNSAHAPTSDNVVLTQKHTLVIVNTEHNLESDNVVLTQEHTLVIVDVSHLVESDNVVLTQKHTLVIVNTEHNLESDNVVLIILGVLVIQNTEHNIESDNVVLVTAGNPLIKIAGTFIYKPVMIKIDGTFVEKTSKVKDTTWK